MVAIIAEMSFVLCLPLGFNAEFDYSVLTDAAAEFGLSLLKEKHLEIDSIIRAK